MVSLGAVAGIVSQPNFVEFATGWVIRDLPVSLASFLWLMAFVLAGWLGWFIRMTTPRSAAFFVWLAMVLCMLVWRPVFSGTEPIWPGALMLVAATLFAAVLQSLLAAQSLVAGWICLPLLGWLAYRAVYVVVLTMAL